MTHNMNKMKGKMVYFGIKVNLTKIYDILKWSFIENILKDVRFPLKIITIILASITTPTTNVKWNEIRLEIFKPQRGIRQENFIPPHLFIICMSKLSNIISHNMEQVFWKIMRLVEMILSYLT